MKLNTAFKAGRIVLLAVLTLVAGLIINFESQVSMAIFQKPAFEVNSGNVGDAWSFAFLVTALALTIQAGTKFASANRNLGTALISVFVLSLGPIIIRALSVGSSNTDWFYWGYAPVGLAAALICVAVWARATVASRKASSSNFVPAILMAIFFVGAWWAGVIRGEFYGPLLVLLVISTVIAWVRGYNKSAEHISAPSRVS